MGNNSRRMPKEVIEMVKKTGCWQPDQLFNQAIHIMASFCIHEEKRLKKWMQRNKKQE